MTRSLPWLLAAGFALSWISLALSNHGLHATIHKLEATIDSQQVTERMAIDNASVVGERLDGCLVNLEAVARAPVEATDRALEQLDQCLRIKAAR